MLSIEKCWNRALVGAIVFYEISNYATQFLHIIAFLSDSLYLVCVPSKEDAGTQLLHEAADVGENAKVEFPRVPQGNAVLTHHFLWYFHQWIRVFVGESKLRGEGWASSGLFVLQVYRAVMNINRGNPFRKEVVVDSWPDFKAVITRPQREVDWRGLLPLFLRSGSNVTRTFLSALQELCGWA